VTVCHLRLLIGYRNNNRLPGARALPLQIRAGDQYMVLELMLIPASPAGFRPPGIAAKPRACVVLPQRGKCKTGVKPHQ
jgi:hypothetical protein